MAAWPRSSPVHFPRGNAPGPRLCAPSFSPACVLNRPAHNASVKCDRMRSQKLRRRPDTCHAFHPEVRQVGEHRAGLSSTPGTSAVHTRPLFLHTSCLWCAHPETQPGGSPFLARGHHASDTWAGLELRWRWAFGFPQTSPQHAFLLAVLHGSCSPCSPSRRQGEHSHHATLAAHTLIPCLLLFPRKTPRTAAALPSSAPL